MVWTAASLFCCWLIYCEFRRKHVVRPGFDAPDGSPVYKPYVAGLVVLALALAWFTHESMHVRGEHNEARPECQALQRNYRTARLLGVPEATARQNAADIYRVLYLSAGRPPSEWGQPTFRLNALPIAPSTSACPTRLGLPPER